MLNDSTVQICLLHTGESVTDWLIWSYLLFLITDGNEKLTLPQALHFLCIFYLIFHKPGFFSWKGFKEYVKEYILDIMSKSHWPAEKKRQHSWLPDKWYTQETGERRRWERGGWKGQRLSGNEYCFRNVFPLSHWNDSMPKSHCSADFLAFWNWILMKMISAVISETVPLTRREENIFDPW